MKKEIPLFLIILLLPNIVTAAAFATNLTVTDIFASKNNHGIISFDANFPNLNTCAAGASYQNALAIDLNTPGGRGMLSVALAAKTANKTVEAQGRTHVFWSPVLWRCGLYTIVALE